MRSDPRQTPAHSQSSVGRHTVNMGKFSLSRLIMCAKYEKLSSEDYLRLGLCAPDSCPDCAEGHGHYVKNDKMMKNNLLLNNQLPEDKLSGQQHQPLKKIVNNLAGGGKGTGKEPQQQQHPCNKCKVINDDSRLHEPPKKQAKGFVNLAFVDQKTESASWYQPHMPRQVAVNILSSCPVGSFIVRNSQSHMSSGCLAMTVRVPRSFNGSGILHYLVVVTEAGFRIKGFSKVFSSLAGLVVHHSVMKEALPCRLLVEDSAGEEESDRDSDFADLDSDPEYPDLVVRLAEQLRQ